DEAARGKHAAFANPALLLLGPTAPGDRFACEVDHRSSSLERGPPRPRGSIGGPRHDLAHGRCRLTCQHSDLVTCLDQARGKRPTEKTGAASDDDSHDLAKNPASLKPVPVARDRINCSDDLHKGGVTAALERPARDPLPEQRIDDRIPLIPARQDIVSLQCTNCRLDGRGAAEPVPHAYI